MSAVVLENPVLTRKLSDFGQVSVVSLHSQEKLGSPDGKAVWEILVFLRPLRNKNLFEDNENAQEVN